MAQVGDRVQVPSKKVGQQPREGIVTGASGSLLRVKWSTGEESTITPAVGSLIVVGRARVSNRSATRGRTGAKSPGATKAAAAAKRRSANVPARKGAKAKKASKKAADGRAKRRK